jgi:hypothetical protein
MAGITNGEIMTEIREMRRDIDPRLRHLETAIELTNVNLAGVEKKLDCHITDERDKSKDRFIFTRDTWTKILMIVITAVITYGIARFA